MLRLLISVALVLTAVAADGGAAARDPWPHTWDVSVFLCGGLGADNWGCPEGDPTPAQLEAATAAVAADPRITEARLADRQEAADDFNRPELSNAPGEKGFSNLFTADDLAFQIEAIAVGTADPDELIEDLGEIPGVTVVYVMPVMYWTGRADVRVQMCGPATEKDLSCVGRGAATDAELAAVAAHLRALPGEPIVYEATPAHSRWNHLTYLRRLGPRWKVPADVAFSTTFWLDLDDTTGRTELLYRLVKLPGVREVGPN
ncbi:hypothetical protein [Herbidospora daliensis]|uniref:hypothetical protein n=1 Tax=Herbidospora daliensis TaxID=295585 RepID=UPI0007837A41|nr:hypothetical protein [Herbidospora daliensis]